tara:strand:- start:394 stop:552 length:159 start_codon:yes stop_codon:yes gene_type:complete
MLRQVKPNGEYKEMKEYLCIEDGEKFIIEAKDWEEARETAAMYNAQVIEEMN